MNLSDLQRITAQLAADPRTTDNTPVVFEFKAIALDGDVSDETLDPLAVHVESSPRRIVFTDRATHLDVAR